MIKYTYDIKEYNFVDEIKKLYEIENLENMHKEWKDAIEYKVLDNIRTDQRTLYHKHFYDNANKTNWYKIYKKFVKEIIRPLFDEHILLQSIPTFRVHQPNNLAVGRYHRDSDYGHSIHEVNFFLPLTAAYDNGTVWTETEKNKKDFQPINAKVGEVWQWDGANLLHGNKLNDTGKTRVSVDFRVLPISKYEETDTVSVTNKTKMIIGEYWEK